MTDMPSQAAAEAAGTTSRSTYVRREAMVSGVMNALLNSVAFFLLFGGSDPVPVWGRGNFALDFLPQACFISLLAFAVPGLLARQARRKGKLAGLSAEGAPAAQAIWTGALLQAVAALLLFAGGAILLLWVLQLQGIAFLPGLAIKIAFGTAIGVLATWRGVRLALRPGIGAAGNARAATAEAG
ncbi:hypothetical protein BV96_02119 [Sphingomonas paucimobilis]|nr:hypothetical protein BV96_02119 [Sphingomonas paucimobilis]